MKCPICGRPDHYAESNSLCKVYREHADWWTFRKYIGSLGVSEYNQIPEHVRDVLEKLTATS